MIDSSTEILLQEEAIASERCSGVLFKLARSKELPLCTSTTALAKVDATLKELLQGLGRTAAPVKIAVARYHVPRCFLQAFIVSHNGRLLAVSAMLFASEML